MSDVMLLGVLRMPVELWGDDELDKQQRHSRYLQAASEIEKMRDVLSELVERNRLRHDLDAYTHELCEWALGNVDEKPSSVDFGV